MRIQAFQRKLVEEMVITKCLFMNEMVNELVQMST